MMEENKNISKLDEQELNNVSGGGLSAGKYYSDKKCPYCGKYTVYRDISHVYCKVCHRDIDPSYVEK